MFSDITHSLLLSCSFNNLALRILPNTDIWTPMICSETVLFKESCIIKGTVDILYNSLIQFEVEEILTSALDQYPNYSMFKLLKSFNPFPISIFTELYHIETKIPRIGNRFQPALQFKRNSGCPESYKEKDLGLRSGETRIASSIVYHGVVVVETTRGQSSGT